MGSLVSEETRIRSALEPVEDVKKSLNKLTNEYPEIMQDVITYIINQCNDASLRGKIDFYQYRLLLENSVDGLHGVIYDVHFPKTEDELAVRDTIYLATRNFVSMLFTRVYYGMDNTLLITDLQTRNPVQIIGQGQQLQQVK